MRIAIDIDGVMTNLEQFVIDHLTKYCVENHIDFNVGQFSYDHSKTFNITKDQEMAFWERHLVDYAINEKARPFTSDVINKLRREGHEIYILTARWYTNQEDEFGKKMRKLVKRWLSKNKIPYDKLIFSKAKNEEKIQEIKQNNFDLVIEDSPSNINQLSKVVPMICYDAQYNRDCDGENIIRCYSWWDIYRVIKENLCK